ncbi:unnamed protein product [Penicillium salamii]|uniref:Cyclin-domain-containing protein n=1 Tax=Penicillium salamii TaxID=1612424 RepID=A0A9W4JCI5_9EURO|nr:unnamed protein product [Penicillium salamii]CAG8094995.1 unnamed protein product [Penicillium salamii]CAG8096275.1 unnamed protein product [Penicillium salamii]CAG8141946.1 unnamed protein product [Penicillium salamii]CAG8190843.1 unnamed protein product [Penicillium salamii]
MLGGMVNSDSVSSRSRSSTPTSTAPPSGGSARPANDVPAYINPVSTRTPSRPPSMTSHAFPPSSTHGYSESTYQSAPDSPRLEPTYKSMQSVPGSEANSPSRIRVQSLSHIQSLANEEIAGSQTSFTSDRSHRQYEISSMPVTEIIEMVAGLLTRITTTNDTHHEHVHRHIPPPDGTSNLTPQATSVLAFHGKNVPSITILSYLTRVHKYCPTTYEVFLSLLVYFDRMTELVNRGQLDHLHHRWDRNEDSGLSSEASDHPMHDSPMATPPAGQDPRGSHSSTPAGVAGLSPESDTEALSHFFVVDSFNIHRLVIAGVTCASKFFSDVFYTNSRYAKVGGLPLVELNHLELQFLLLNDFRLAISVEELESYGTMLVEFYAREVVAQQQQQQQQHMTMPRSIDPIDPADAYSDAMYMRSRDKPHDHAAFGQPPTPP